MDVTKDLRITRIAKDVLEVNRAIEAKRDVKSEHGASKDWKSSNLLKGLVMGWVRDVCERCALQERPRHRGETETGRETGTDRERGRDRLR